MGRGLVECACGCGAVFPKYDRYGRPRRFVHGHGRTVPKIEDRFWPCVEKSERCWEWQGTKTAAGYGVVHWHSKRLYAHRVSYELHYGKISPKDHILHRCDNPGCVNPGHLFLGTPLANTHDAIKKGRLPGTCLSGGDVEMIRKLFAMGSSQAEITRAFRVHQSTISRIVNNKRRV